MSELLPCPFCGGEAEIVGGPENWTPTFYDPDGGGDPIAVVCKTCACGLHFFDGYAEAIAAWNRRADARQHALKTRVCPMCEDCPDGCPVETPKDSRTIVTNADRIRSMSDEELAVWILRSVDCDKENIMCIPALYKNSDKCDGRCRDGRLSWLQQPAKEEHYEAD